MAEMTIRLRVDPTTGKKDIVVSLSGDADALPHEHEQMHRKLVEKLIQGGLVQASELGQIIVERVEEDAVPPVTEAAPQEERRAEQQGGAS